MTSRESRAFVSETVGGSSSFALVRPICPYHTSPRLKGTYADSCNALMSCPRHDLSRHDVGAKISAMEDSADAALSRVVDAKKKIQSSLPTAISNMLHELLLILRELIRPKEMNHTTI